MNGVCFPGSYGNPGVYIHTSIIVNPLILGRDGEPIGTTWASTVKIAG